MVVEVEVESNHHGDGIKLVVGNHPSLNPPQSMTTELVVMKSGLGHYPMQMMVD